MLETGDQKLTYSGIGYYHPNFFKKYTSNKNRFPLAPLLYKSAKDKNLSGQYYIGYWNDVGTPEQLEEIKDTYSISK